MTMTQRIAIDLPLLRRFSRAVAGSQTSGDAYVAATLEAMIADRSILTQQSSDRVSLYKLFVTILNSANLELRAVESPYPWERVASRSLSALPSQARQAFLLASVEAFSQPEIGEILDLPLAAVGQLLDEAAHEISRQIATDIMIIEDEPLIALDLEQIVEDLGHTVCGIARTRDEALALYHKARPKMILSDIQLADGSSGIDAINEILTKVSIPVIFVTAFPERLLTGQRAEPTFLLPKPYNPDMLKALVSQALFFNESMLEDIAIPA